MTSQPERDLLLRLARAAIVAHVGGAPLAAIDPNTLDRRRGAAFVSLHTRAGELRGCIGHLEHDQSLPDVVARCAVAACSADPRFTAVSPAEVGELQIELSLLGPLEPVAGAVEIEIGRHGLVIEKGSRRGLLLPQVATEWKWDGRRFLAETCRKAGLPQDAWEHGARIWRFEAEVFGDDPPSSGSSR
ncbi:MAG: AmmeMemoRadiSam system protein A [Acidobacteriota bacterium]